MLHSALRADYQPLAMAEKRWRAIRSPLLAQQVPNGTRFLGGSPDQEVEGGGRAA